jgi:hypothetical protein
MKYIEKISLMFLLMLFFGLCISSCTIVDEPTIVTPKTADQYVKQFSDFVKSELHAVRTDTVGYAKGDFAYISKSSFNTYKTNYLTALIADSAIIATPDTTITALVNANTSLSVPGKAFWGKINIADKRGLNSLIVTATNLGNSTLVGTLTGNVSQDTKTALATAVANAITTRDAFTTIDRQVTDGIAALNLSITTFNNSIVK